MNSPFTWFTVPITTPQRRDGDVVFILVTDGNQPQRRQEEILRFMGDGQAQIRGQDTKDNFQIFKAFKTWLGNSNKPVATVGEDIVFQTPTKDWLTIKPTGEIWINGQFVKIDVPCLTNFKRFVYQLGYSNVERSIFFKSGMGSDSSADNSVVGGRGGDISLMINVECHCPSLLHGHQSGCHLG